jgi:hypothetical protein
MVGQSSANPVATGHEPANLGDILERVLDRGIVIVGDIRVSLLDIELLTLKLRLVVASVDTARQMGIDWWEHDPWLTSRAPERLPTGVADADAIEDKAEERRADRSLEAASGHGDTGSVRREEQRG